MTAAARFVVIGDLQETARIEFWREDNAAERTFIVRSIAEQKPDFAVLLGDLVFDGSSRAHWTRFDALVAPLLEARVPLVPILGNHDYWWGKRRNLVHVAERFPDLGRRSWHHRRFRELELVFLDSNFSALSPPHRREQAHWFERVLRAADADGTCGGTLVFVHHPPFTNSAIGGGSSVVRRSFLNAFLRAEKTRAMLSGHVHSYERFERDGKTFIVSGGGGGPRVRLVTGALRRHRDLYSRARPGRRPCHYLDCHLSGERLRIEVMGLEKGQQSFECLEAFELDLVPSDAGDADAG